MKKIILAVAVATMLSGAAYAQDFQKGFAAYQAGDYATALQEWRPLAEQGYAEAQFNLGVMYDTGRGVPQDYAEAVNWYRKAAEQGDAEAQYNLGVRYTNGHGVPQDYAEAVNLYRKAAEQGDAEAQSNLGFMYIKGQGVPQDYLLAHMWFNIGSANGSENGAKNRSIVAKNMIAQDISAAQAMARDCMSSNYQNCGY
jgi:TPR repeat protein